MHALLGTGFFSSCSTVAVTSSVLFLELSEFRFFAAAGLSFLPSSPYFSFLPPDSGGSASQGRWWRSVAAEKEEETAAAATVTGFS